MSRNHDPFSELAAAHALGSLDGDDLARFQAHLTAGCAECERLLGDYREALVGPAADLRTTPPSRVKQELMARAARRRARPGGRFWSGLRWAASVAVAAGLLASAVATYVSGRYEARLGQMAREVAALHEQIREQRLTLALLRDPATQVITLDGLAPSPQARARVIWNEREGGVFVAAGLPAAPRDKVYELWAIVGATPRPAGLFVVDAEGKGGVRVAPLGGAPPVDRFAVTLEPAQGAPAPTGPMYLASQ